MQIRTFVGGAILCVLVARHAWSSRSAAAPPARRPVVREARVTLHADAAVQPQRARPVVVPDGLRVLEAELEQAAASEADRIAAIEETLGGRGLLDGWIHDATTGEPLVGATIVVSAPGMPTHTAVSDEAGSYRIADLLPGHSTSTVYYDRAMTDAELDVVASRITQQDREIDPDVAIEAPVRTFDNVVVAAPGDVDQDVTFTGCGSSLENRYDVDDVDVTGLTFGEAD